MKTLKKLSWFYNDKTNKKRYIIGIIGLLFTYVFVPIPSWVIGASIDSVKNSSLDYKKAIIYTSIFLISIIGRYIAGFVWQYFIFGNSSKIGRDSRRKIMKKLLKQTPEFYKENSTGSLMSKATYDVGNIQMVAGYGILAFFEATVWPLTILALMGFTISWRMTLLSVIVLPFVAIASRKIGKYLEDIYLRIQKSFEKLNESVLENINSIRVIKGFSTYKVTKERFDERVDDIFKNQMKQWKISALFIPLGRLIPAITFVIALYIGEKYVASGSLTLGKMVTFFMYLNMLTWPMMAFGDLINVYEESTSSIRRIQEVYDYKEDMVDEKDAEIYNGEGNIEFKNFDFNYPGIETKALENVNLLIKKGQTIGIVGKVGSGKTTLIKQFLRLYNVKKNTFLFNDKSVEKYTISSIREQLGYVPQTHILFSKSVFDNIAFGSRGATKEEVMEAIRFADFEKDLYTLENGLDTIIGEKGISISGGQKQRISIARAIIKDPEILILDDSLSAVDAITEKNIIENIREKRKDKTTIIVAHRLSGLKHADQIIVLDRGKIVEHGNHEQLINNKAWYYEQYESQRLGGADE